MKYYLFYFLIDACAQGLMELSFVTGNIHKVQEIKNILSDIIINHVDIDVKEIQGTIDEIAIEKAKEAARLLERNVLVEDTSLAFNAFGSSLPGPYIKHFVKEIGTSKIPLLLSCFKDKGATAICTFAFCKYPEMRVSIFKGKCEVITGLSRGK